MASSAQGSGRMGFFHWLWIARPLKVISMVSFSLANWILSVVMGCSVAYFLFHILCLFDLLHLGACRRGNLAEDGFARLAVAAIFRLQGAIHHVGQGFHHRIIGRELVRRFEFPDGQLAV